MSRSSRIAGFFRMSPRDRVSTLVDAGWLSRDDGQALLSGQHTIGPDTADKMIENVVGVFGLPLGIALNFLINDDDHIIPLAVEEPSIVAGLSGTAKLCREGGGFHFTPPDTQITGQVQLVGCSDAQRAAQLLQDAKAQLIGEANASQPNMVARGGGVVDLDTHIHTGPESGATMVVLHLHIDSRDAMGANLVNAICEHIAPLTEQITGGRAVLRILSNLTDRAVATASVRVPSETLAGRGMSGEEVRDGIIVANDLALADPYRAATHNKGIMNGVDAIVVATGNDWRAIEAAAHAYAARDGSYRALTRWRADERGALVGEIELPVKVGTVGGSLQSNPAVGIAHRLLGNPGASELAGIIAVVGLAQNLAALRSLATNGIQSNHMRLHARSVVSTAGVPESLFEKVTTRLIESGEIKVWKAQEIAASLQPEAVATEDFCSEAAAKVILMGEHAAVYGEPAIAVPVSGAMQGRHRDNPEPGVRLQVPSWGMDIDVTEDAAPVSTALRRILERFELPTDFQIEVHASVPAGMGLGGSAALAVCVLRTLSHRFDLEWDDEQINALAFELEEAAHGTPSGVDNTVATHARPLRYARAESGEQTFETLALPGPLHLVVGLAASPGSTAEMVASVRQLTTEAPEIYGATISRIGELTRLASDALGRNDKRAMGHLMNACQGHLNALQVSTPELETMLSIARAAGALGAKLTGGGGGGSIVALAADQAAQTDISSALEAAGFGTLTLEVT